MRKDEGWKDDGGRDEGLSVHALVMYLHTQMVPSNVAACVYVSFLYELQPVSHIHFQQDSHLPVLSSQL